MHRFGDPDCPCEACLGNREAEKLETWRLDQLLRAGYPVRAAEHLAKDFDVDLHRAVELVDAGCPPELARDILT